MLVTEPTPRELFLAAFARMQAAHEALLVEPRSELLASAFHVACLEARRAFDLAADHGYRAHREARERRSA